MSITQTRQEYQRTTLTFASADGHCVADLYRPGLAMPPVIIMAHGFSAERSWKLPAYAAEFAANGYAVLLFDYRNFGDSPGEPRQLISPARHLEDYRNALAYIRTRADLDQSKVVLWGTSFSAGHAMALAAEEPQIAAACFLVPFFDFWPVLQMVPLPAILALLPYALADAALGLLGASLPVQIAGNPGEAALLTFPGWKQGILDGIPADSRWKNQTPARVALELPFFRPGLRASSLKMPVQIIYGSHDTGIPYKAVEETADQIHQCERVKLKMGHIDPFKDKWFVKVVAHQIQFLNNVL